VGLLVVLLILALVFGGVGLLIEGLRWVLIIALVLLLASFISGFASRGSSRA
jgi:ABC-type multidrug transport system permease subunit